MLMLRYISSALFSSSPLYNDRGYSKNEEKIMQEKELVLEAMRKAGEPLNAGKIAELSGLDRKVVDKAMAEMKKTGEIVSPVRCKWEPATK